MSPRLSSSFLLMLAVGVLSCSDQPEGSSQNRVGQNLELPDEREPASNRDAPIGVATHRSVKFPFRPQQDPEVAFRTQWGIGNQSIRFAVARDGRLIHNFPAPDGEGSWNVVTHWNGAEPIVRGRDGMEVQVIDGSEPRNEQAYEEIELVGLWEGIDVLLTRVHGNVEQTYVVHPGSSPDLISAQIEGGSTTITKEGELEVETGFGPVAFTKPVAFQYAADGRRESVDVKYVLDDNTYGFGVGAYDESRSLHIDPMVRATYFGTAVADLAVVKVFDTPNSTTIALGTRTIFPGTIGGFQPTPAGTTSNMFLANFSEDLSTLNGSTFFGGIGRNRNFWFSQHQPSGDIFGSQWAVNGFPAAPTGFQTNASGADDFGMVRFSPAGVGGMSPTTRVGATFWGGAGDDQSSRNCTNAATGAFFVVGENVLGAAPPLPGTGVDKIKTGDTDGMIGRFSADLTTLEASSLYGDGDEEALGACTVDSVTGDVFFTGGVRQGTTIPFSTGAFQATAVSIQDPFVCRFNADLDLPVRCSHFGVSAAQTTAATYYAPLMVVHPNGDLYMVSWVDQTAEWFTPHATAFQSTVAGGQDLAIVRWSSDLTSVVAATFIGGGLNEQPLDLLVLDNGNLMISGFTESTNFPGTANGLQPASAGSRDGFITIIEPTLDTLVQSTYFGSTDLDAVTGIALKDDALYLTGYIGNALVGTTGGFQATHQGGGLDLFISTTSPTLAVVCGDNFQDLSEACDDGNVVDGDGCSSNCLVENTFECTDDGDCLSTDCDTTLPNPVCVPVCGNNMIETGEGCDDGGTDAGDGCSATCLVENDNPCGTSANGLTGAASCESGLCDMTEMPAPLCEAMNVCGNSVLDATEGCDDGNTDAGDGCGTTCLIESGTACGTDPAGVTGASSCESGICDTTEVPDPLCENADTCGNGVLETGEGCDDGNTDPADGCDASCLIEDGGACNTDVAGATGAASCSSGVCDMTETPNPICEAADTCGNGTIETGEGCDDGNTDAGDGCNGTCLIEDGGACSTDANGATGNASCESGICDMTETPSPICEPEATCGNGTVETGEGCDDGNTDAGDGCNAECLIEDGSACSTDDNGETGSSSCESGVCDMNETPAPICEPSDTCGNGTIEAGEGCDDGNTDAGDGCGETCLVETGSPCGTDEAGVTGSESCESGMCEEEGDNPVCLATEGCGNGVIESGEGCDDGNKEAGDGCNASCLVENGNPCGTDSNGTTNNASCESGICDDSETEPTCEAAGACGNGVVEDGEVCDDGNTANRDECSSDCSVASTSMIVTGGHGSGCSVADTENNGSLALVLFGLFVGRRRRRP